MAIKDDLSGKNVVLGLQHTFVMFGATVLVPIITGLDVGVTLFTAGVGTLFFHIITQFKIPIFLGSSFAFIPGILAVKGTEGLPAAMGGIMVAGLLYVVVAIVFKFISYETIHRILPPHVTGPMIILIGLILAPVAIANANGNNAKELQELIGTNGCWAIALFTFSVGIFVKVGLRKHRTKFISNIPVIIALVAGYALSLIIGIVDFTAVREAPWFGLPSFSLPRFTAGAIAVMVPIAIVTIVEHFGDILAIGNVVGKDYVVNPGIHRTLIGDGLATSIAGFLGGPANTTYSENTGAIALTGVSNPVIMRIAACFAILLSLVPKFTALIGSIPLPVVGGIAILLFGMISSIGIKNMVDAQVNLSNPKILIISATMLVIGLGGANLELGPMNLSGLGLAAIFGVVLNLILQPKETTEAVEI